MFVGREDELAAAVAGLAAPGVVTLRGAPGVGKTALADRVAAALTGRGWRVLRASLAGATDPIQAASAALRAAGVASPGASFPETLGALANVLRAPQVLALFDDVDAPAAVEVVSALAGLGEATCLVTGPVALGVPTERVIAVEPLPSVDAARLLQARVARAGGRVTEDEASALVTRASGLPLVLELLAPQVAAVGPEAALVALRRDGLDAGLLTRAFARAVARLSPRERDALGALSTLHGEFSAERAAAVIGGTRPGDVLLALCAASWVMRSPPDRFRLLPSVRDFATTLAGPDAAARHAAAVLAALPASDDEQALAAWVADRDDLGAAWRWAVEADAGEALGRLALASDLVFVRTGPSGEHLAMLARTLASPSLTPAHRSRLHLAVGRSHALRGRHRAALQAYAEARALLPDPDAVDRDAATCAAVIAFSLRALGDTEAARDEARRTFACAAGDLDRLAAAEITLGLVELAARAFGDAAEAFGRAAALARLAKAPRMEGLAYANLALTHLETLDGDAAADAAARARACLAQAADRFQLARVAHMEGRAALLRGRLDEAEAALELAATAAAADNDLEFDLRAREGLVALALARGQGALARARFAELAALARVAEDVSWPAQIARLAERVAASPTRAVVLRLDPEGRQVRLDGRTLDFARRGPLRRVLLGLARARIAGETLTVSQLLDAGWPGERMLPGSGAARVYMAVRRLRELGLEGILLTTDEGYALAPHCRVELEM